MFRLTAGVAVFSSDLRLRLTDKKHSKIVCNAIVMG